jgi:hypothetical protein
MNRYLPSILAITLALYPMMLTAQEVPSPDVVISPLTGEPILPTVKEVLPPATTSPILSVSPNPRLDFSTLGDSTDTFTLPTSPTSPSDPTSPALPAQPQQLPTGEVDPDLAASVTTTQPGAPTTSAPLSVTEVHRFQLQLAESTYQLSKDLKSRSELLLAYERLIGPVCMGAAHQELDYIGNDPANTDCSDLITKAEALFPKSPVIVCAKNGYENPECLTLTKNQPRGRIDFKAADSDSGKPLFDLEAKLQQSSLEPQLKAIDEGLSKIVNDEKLSEEEKTKRLRRVYSFGIDLACRLFRVRLDQIGGSSEDPILKRTRLVTEECDSLINRAEREVPNIPAIACARFGYYSPNCIDSIKALRDEALLAPSGEGSMTSPTPPLSNDNIGHF